MPPRFLNEALPTAFVRQALSGEDLECDKPVQVFITGFIYLAHAAGAELFDDPVMCDRLSEHSMI
jgi:hypothetical protein